MISATAKPGRAERGIVLTMLTQIAARASASIPSGQNARDLIVGRGHVIKPGEKLVGHEPDAFRNSGRIENSRLPPETDQPVDARRKTAPAEGQSPRRSDAPLPPRGNGGPGRIGFHVLGKLAIDGDDRVRVPA